LRGLPSTKGSAPQGAAHGTVDDRLREGLA
jgi:hypothetical protein